MRNIYVNEHGHRVELLNAGGDIALYHPAGGGFQFKMLMTDFNQMYKPEVSVPEFKLTLVGAEWLPNPVPCYSNGQRWNGWMMPNFTLINGLSLLQHMPDLVYVDKKDVFVNLWDPDEVEVYSPHTITVDGESIKVYAIGSGSWCWEDAPEASTLPSDPDGMNGERADEAGKALRAINDVDVLPENAARNLICNLRHWCDRNNVDFHQALKEANEGYESETTD